LEQPPCQCLNYLKTLIVIVVFMCLQNAAEADVAAETVSAGMFPA
jgi:hypothetical protein